VDVTEQTWESEVVERSRELPVVVDFWADWCGPCHALAPVLERAVAERGDGVALVKVDVDANPVLSQAFNIMSIPTIAFFRPGKDENGNAYTPQGVVGFRPLEHLEAQFGLKQFTPAPSEQVADTAA